MTYTTGVANTLQTSFRGGFEAEGQAAAQVKVFNGARTGVMYNMWHPHDMFQDLGGTIPVTAENQDVLSITDANNNGILAVSSGSDHPVWDGTHLVFSAGAYMQVAMTVPKSSRTVIFAGTPTGGDTRKTVVEAYGNATAYALLSLGLNNNKWETYPSVATPLTAPDDTTLNVPVVLTLRREWIDDSSDTFTEIRVNGAVVASATQDPDNAGTTADGFRFGANRNAERKMTMRASGLVVAFDNSNPTIADDHIVPTDLETWFALRAGVTLA